MTSNRINGKDCSEQHKKSQETQSDVQKHMKTMCYINDEYLKHINKFSDQISASTESYREIQQFFSKNPDAKEILKRQVLRYDNYAILKLHLINNIKVDHTMLLKSLKGENLSRKNCFIIFELHANSLIDDFESIKAKFMIFDNYLKLFEQADIHVKLKILERDWNAYEKRKYRESLIKNRKHDVIRMIKRKEKLSQILCKEKKATTFLVIIDLDSFNFEQSNFRAKDLTELTKDENKTKLSNQLPLNIQKLQIIVDFFKKSNQQYIIVQKEDNNMDHCTPAMFQETVKYTSFDYNFFLQTYDKKRCFILKENHKFAQLNENCYILNFQKLYLIIVNS